MNYILKTHKVVLLIFFIGQIGLAQIRTQGVTHQRNNDKSVTFKYTNNVPGSVYVVLKFDQLSNASSDVIKKTIQGYSGELVTLYPQNTNEGINFSYAYRTLKGNLKAKPDTAFKYVLPFKRGTSIKVRDLGYLGKRFGDAEPKNWRSFMFLVKPNDTVYAIRKGVVISVIDGEKSDSSDDMEYSFKNKTNRLVIEHEDGTMASYGVLKNHSFMVGVGDVVYPSAPLAIAGSYDKIENSQLRLSLYYLDDIVEDLDFDEKSKEKFGSRTHIYAYINPLFLVNENEVLKLGKNETYKAFCTNDIIEEEMTKREKKGWLKTGKLIN